MFVLEDEKAEEAEDAAAVVMTGMCELECEDARSALAGATDGCCPQNRCGSWNCGGCADGCLT